MADRKTVVPYNDPYDSSYTDDIINFINDPNPTWTDLSLFDESSILPSSSNHPQSRDEHIITDSNDPFNDPLLWDIGNNFNGGSSQAEAGPSENRAEASMGGRLEIENWVNMKAFPIWPVTPEPFLCSCCLVLREIIHTNGRDTTKLEIHGRLGIICHAVFEMRQNGSNAQYHMIDFCKKSIESVKEYLIQYCRQQRQAGFMMLPDPLSFFYEAVCVGLDLDENLSTNDFSQPTRTNSGTNEIHQPETENDTGKTQKTSLAAQRERTTKLRLKDLENYFHLPIEQAARKMQLCPTVVKKICRRDGLPRWPHRKIKSIQRRMSIMSARLSSNDAEDRATAQEEIHKLREEMAAVFSGLSK